LKAVVQRVRRASVSVEGDLIAAIGEGFMVLLGVAEGDDEAAATKISDKISKLRIFDDAEGRLTDSLGDREVLCVSQFTLLADTARGNRPGFQAAARPEVAEPLYDLVCDRLGAEKGVFGAEMTIDLECHGPVTILLET
jgi:D-tyrosyl-tRNA(Tyr) deacylase